MRARRATIAAVTALVAMAAAPTAPASPEATRGEAIYARCQACHALSFDRVGPRHCGLFGRRAGSVPGFAYSPAMQHAAITWNEQSLDRFLAAPMRAVPGTTMTYAGVADRRERADLIAYLRQVDRTPTCRSGQAAGSR